jgi:hypothetical protein
LPQRLKACPDAELCLLRRALHPKLKKQILRCAQDDGVFLGALEIYKLGRGRKGTQDTFGRDLGLGSDLGMDGIVGLPEAEAAGEGVVVAA